MTLANTLLRDIAIPATVATERAPDDRKVPPIAEIAEIADTPRFRWAIREAGAWMEVRFAPCVLRAQVEALYPGRAVEELPDEAEAPPDDAVVEQDQRRTCRQCRNLNREGQCLAAHRGDAIWAPARRGRAYFPVADLRQCCPAYQPSATDADWRSGIERWPQLTGEYWT